jgi:hypothetical protein
MYDRARQAGRATLEPAITTKARHSNTRSRCASEWSDATERKRGQPMTCKGHALSTFARAVKTGNPNVVVAAVAELPKLSP